MAIAFAKFFQPTMLTTSVASIYPVPSVPSSNVLKSGRVRLTNVTGAAATAQVYAVPASGSASTTNAFFLDGTVPANDYVDVDVPILAAGDSIQAKASAATTINIQAIGGALFSA